MNFELLNKLAKTKKWVQLLRLWYIKMTLSHNDNKCIFSNIGSGFHSRDHVMTVDDLVLALDNPELYNLLPKTHDLASVDLRTLDTPVKQMVFYSNIVNFLYIHTILLVIAMGTKPSKWDGLNDILAFFNGSGLTLEMINTSSIIQATYFTKVGYFVGQLGLISCFDLHHTILKRGLTLPHTLVKRVDLSSPLKLLTPDPWALHAPSASDPRLVFVIHDGRLSSPTPVPLTQDNFEDKLNFTEAQYLSSVVIIDPQSKEISVPEWLFDSCQDLLKSEQSTDPDLCLLKYVHLKLDKEKADIFQSIDTNELPKAKKVNVIVRPNKPQIGFDFTLKHSTSNPTPRRLSRQSSRNLTSPLPVVAETKSETPKHTFTTEILKFIEQRAPLLAALVYLLSPPQSVLDDKVESVQIEDSLPVGKMEGIIQSIRNKVTNTKTTAIVPIVKKDANETKQVENWQLTYDQVLGHFSTAVPMRQYLVTRLSPFNSLIQWDDPRDESLSDSSNEFGVCLRTLAALPSSCDALGEACSYVMRKLVESGRVMEAVNFLTSEPALKHPEKLAFFSDVVLSAAFVSNYNKTVDDDEKINPLIILSQISNPELASRLTLASLRYWPVRVCENLLSYCLNHLPPTALLRQTVEEKLNYMRIYSLIISSCESPLHLSKCPWKDWYSIAKDSETRPDYVFQLLLSSRAFDIARHWAAVHNVGAELSQQIEVEYLSYLLEGDSSNSIAAQQVVCFFILDVLIHNLYRTNNYVRIHSQNYNSMSKIGSGQSL